MALQDLTEPSAVLQAIEEFEVLGRDGFLAKYRFGRSKKYFLIHDHKKYDSKAIAGVAHQVQFGHALTHEEFSGGESATVKRLRYLGFVVQATNVDYLILTRPDVIETLQHFDSLGRDAFLDEYGGGPAAKFVIDWPDGKLDSYDAKAVLVVALRKHSEYSNLESEDVDSTRKGVAEPLEHLGFTVKERNISKDNFELVTASIASKIQRVMELIVPYEFSINAPSVRECRLNLQSIMESYVDGLPIHFGAPDGNSWSLSGDYSRGAGRFPRVPWVRLTDTAKSHSATDGWYVVLLFAFDGQSCYLSLNQGTTTVLAPNKRDKILARALWTRNLVDFGGGSSTPQLLNESGGNSEWLELLATISLDDHGLGKDYENGNVWGIRYDRDNIPDDAVLLADANRLLMSLGKVYDTADSALPPSAGGPLSGSLRSLIDEIAAELNWDVSQVRRLIDGIESKGQIILSGPPGTGKTFVAERLAKYFVDGESSRVRLVQFHPSYGYEDFVEGLRPQALPKGGFEFVRVPGALVKTTMEILGDGHDIVGDGQRRVLIVDEINRANIPRVFGELMYLLEYRDRSMKLMLDDRDFKLPNNLFIIATMNTADRSTRSLDVAMRRRFKFFTLDPDVQVLRKIYLKPSNENRVGDTLFTGFVLLNEKLTKEIDKHHTIGHSFFVHETMDSARLRNIWDEEILPLIEDYFFDQPDMAEKYQFEDFWPDA